MKSLNNHDSFQKSGSLSTYGFKCLYQKSIDVDDEENISENGHRSTTMSPMLSLFRKDRKTVIASRLSSRQIRLIRGTREIQDRGSRFVGHVAVGIRSLQDVVDTLELIKIRFPDVVEAAHPSIHAYRYSTDIGLFSSKNVHMKCASNINSRSNEPTSLNKKRKNQTPLDFKLASSMSAGKECESTDFHSTMHVKEGAVDDGERLAGGKILAVLRKNRCISHFVSVTRWFGGILLGPVRFQHITDVAEKCVSEISQELN